MTDEVKAEYEASWTCPRCESLGNFSDKDITHDGDSLAVICNECQCKYTVIL